MTEREVKRRLGERAHMVEDQVNGIPQRKFLWMKDAVEVCMEIVRELQPDEDDGQART